MLDTFPPTRKVALARVNGVRPSDHARSRNALEGGVEALVRSAAATYAGQGLRINAVAPGMTDTPMTAGMLKTPAMREDAARQYPLRGLQTADQVADVKVWLLGDGAARLTAAGDRGGRRLHHHAVSGEIDAKQIEATTGSSK